MAYTKQNFVDGLTLSAAELNHIEDGIVALEENWFEIADITSTEEVSSLLVSEDKSGNTFECRKFVGVMTLPEGVPNNQQLQVSARRGSYATPYVFGPFSSSTKHFTFSIELTKDMFIEYEMSMSTASGYLGNTTKYGLAQYGVGEENWLRECYLCFPAGGVFPVGTRLKVWGLRA